MFQSLCAFVSFSVNRSSAPPSKYKRLMPNSAGSMLIAPPPPWPAGLPSAAAPPLAPPAFALPLPPFALPPPARSIGRVAPGLQLQVLRSTNCGIRCSGAALGPRFHLSLIHISEPTRQAEISY